MCNLNEKKKNFAHEKFKKNTKSWTKIRKNPQINWI